MKVKRLGITEILRSIWLFSANKIKSSKSGSKQPTQLIIAAHNCHTNWIYNARVQKFELTCCKVSIGFEKAGVDK